MLKKMFYRFSEMSNNVVFVNFMNYSGQVKFIAGYYPSFK